jgi:hypothetical protein
MLDLAPYRRYVQDLHDYRVNFETLAEEARQHNDYEAAVMCLLQAIKLRSSILQVDQMLVDYSTAQGQTPLPDLTKVWS